MLFTSGAATVAQGNQFTRFTMLRAPGTNDEGDEDASRSIARTDRAREMDADIQPDQNDQNPTTGSTHPISRGLSDPTAAKVDRTAPMASGVPTPTTARRSEGHRSFISAAEADADDEEPPLPLGSRTSRSGSPAAPPMPGPSVDRTPVKTEPKDADTAEKKLIDVLGKGALDDMSSVGSGLSYFLIVCIANTSAGGRARESKQSPSSWGARHKCSERAAHQTRHVSLGEE